MRKTRKRLSTLLLAICLVLSMAVPVVWAEVTDEVVKTYNFDYYAASPVHPTEETYSEDIAKRIGKDSEGKSYFTLHSTKGAVFEESSGAIAQYYDDLGWKYEDSDLSNASVFVENGYSHSNKHTSNFGYYRVSSSVGDWVAFKIKNPGANTPRHIEITYPAHMDGAEICNVYILPATTSDIGAEIATADKIGSVSFWNSASIGSADVSKTGTISTAPVGVWTPGNDEDYILVFEAAKANSTKNTARMFISQVTMSADADKVSSANNAKAITVARNTTNVAEAYNITTYHNSVADAITAANDDTSIDTIALVSDTNADSITVPEGVTLDLNGHALTASSVIGVKGSEVMDSSKDNSGVLKTSNLSMSSTNSQLPLYDATSNGYRFFKASMNSIDADTTSMENAAKLRFQVKFDNVAAYALVAGGNSGLKIEGTFTGTLESGTEIDNAGIFKYEGDEDGTVFAKAWGIAANAKEGKVAIIVTMSGLDAVSDLKLTPSVTSAGVTISGTALEAK